MENAIDGMKQLARYRNEAGPSGGRAAVHKRLSFVDRSAKLLKLAYRVPASGADFQRGSCAIVSGLKCRTPVDRIESTMGDPLSNRHIR
jgi:hypothetical protein